MASEPEVAEVAAALGKHGAGRVIGALRGTSGTDCEIELVMIFPEADRVGGRRTLQPSRFLLRHAVVDLDRLSKVRNELNIGKFTPQYPRSDREFGSIEEALDVASDLSSRSMAVPLPALARWTEMRPFAELLTPHNLRRHVPWLPNVPRWQIIARSIANWILLLAIILTIIFSAAAESAPDAAPSTRTMLNWGLIAFAAIVAFRFSMFVLDTVKAHRNRRGPRALETLDPP